MLTDARLVVRPQVAIRIAQQGALQLAEEDSVTTTTKFLGKARRRLIPSTPSHLAPACIPQTDVARS